MGWAPYKLKLIPLCRNQASVIAIKGMKNWRLHIALAQSGRATQHFGDVAGSNPVCYRSKLYRIVADT